MLGQSGHEGVRRAVSGWSRRVSHHEGGVAGAPSTSSSRSSPTSRQAVVLPAAGRTRATTGARAVREGHLRPAGGHASTIRLNVPTVGTGAPDSYRINVADEVPARRATSRWERPVRARTNRS